jgi:excinuclease UvrABC nuclease subunit
LEAISNRFGTLAELENATVDDLARVPGMNRALAEKVLNGHS